MGTGFRAEWRISVSESSEGESQMRVAFGAGDYRVVATLMIQHYGAEIQDFLASRLQSATDRDEAFSMFVEDLWAGLPGFAWRCSARGWGYALARNASNRLLRAPQQRRQRNLTLSERASLSALMAHARSTTQIYLRTEAKDRIRAIRDRLEPDDQMLLILRVDKRMPFRELALVMNDGQLDSERVDEEAARLRKRFERVKAQIREMARAEGLLGAKEDE
jgi:RNA polymerase sigma-70 factor (ECF subfamily)